MRSWVFDILYGMSERNVPRVLEAFFELCSVRERTSRTWLAYRREMNEILSELPNLRGRRRPLHPAAGAVPEHEPGLRIPVPHDFVLVSKALTTFEGTCLSLDPESGSSTTCGPLSGSTPHRGSPSMNC